MRGEAPGAPDTSPERASVIGFDHLNVEVAPVFTYIPSRRYTLLMDSMADFRHRFNVYRLPLFRVEATARDVPVISSPRFLGELSPSANCSTPSG